MQRRELGREKQEKEEQNENRSGYGLWKQNENWKSEDEENDDKIKQNKEEVGVSKKLKVIRNRGIK